VLSNLEEIGRQVVQVSEVMDEIAAGADQQSQGVEQINTAVEQMNHVTQQTAANAEESSSASEELTGQAEELRQLVSEYALTGTSRGAGRERARPVPARAPARPVPGDCAGSRDLKKGPRHADPYGERKQHRGVAACRPPAFHPLSRRGA
jgi:methyl-accepting chemotaxis protein